MAATYIVRQGKNSSAVIFGSGNSSYPTALEGSSANGLGFWMTSAETGSDIRGIYDRLYLTTAAASGEALRAFTSIQNVIASQAHGAHISLSFGTSGSMSGSGIATRSTLHMPSTALPASNVTYSAVQAEIYSDAATSDPTGNLISFFRAVNGGDETGGEDVDDDVALFDISGVTIASGNMVAASTTEANYSHSVRVRINGTNYYMMLASAEG